MVDRLPRAAPLPSDAVALHIGIHKTGTTAIQAALADARPELAAHGVLYPGKGQAQHGAAMAILDRPWGWVGRGEKPANPRAFERIAAESRRHPGRVIISSETFCQCDDGQAARVVDGLGLDRTHVIVAFRNLGRLLPSTWQQYLKYGRTTPYERWLEVILDPDYDGKMTPTFWQRNDQSAQVRRWANQVGADRVVVLILENVAEDALFLAFAEMLNLPEDLLTARKHLSTNRSMSAVEAEFLRRLNHALRGRLDWPAYQELVRHGVVGAMLSGRRPGPGEPRLHTPDWALDAVALRAARDVEAIRASGVTVLGDLDALRVRASSPPPVDPESLNLLSTDAAVEVVAHEILASSARWNTEQRRNTGQTAMRRSTAKRGRSWFPVKRPPQSWRWLRKSPTASRVR